MIRVETVNAVATERQGETLPSLVDRASTTLANARSAAEVLEAHDLAGIAYDMAKRAARMAEAKGAHDTLVAAAHRAQGDALLIEARAKHRLADEYDAAQERGEVRRHGVNDGVSGGETPGHEQLSLPAKLIHNARRLRDAETADPGIVERTVEDALERGEEPTRAMVNRATEDRWKAVAEKHEADMQRIIAEREFKKLRAAFNKAPAAAQALFREWLAAKK